MNNNNTQNSAKTGLIAENLGDDREIEIDLLELTMMLMTHIKVIILCFVIGVVAAGCCAYYLVTPTYQSTAKMYMVAASSGSVVNLTDLNIGTSLTNDYIELIGSYPVLDKVSENLKLDLTADEVSKLVQITNPSQTRIVEITATTDDPQKSADLANMICEVAIQYLPETMNTEKPNVAQVARPADTKYAPSLTRYCAIGGILGLVIICGWYILKHMMDDTIRNSEEMLRYFGQEPLTVIPYSKALDDNDRKGGKKS